MNSYMYIKNSLLLLIFVCSNIGAVPDEYRSQPHYHQDYNSSHALWNALPVVGVFSAIISFVQKGELAQLMENKKAVVQGVVVLALLKCSWDMSPTIARGIARKICSTLHRAQILGEKGFNKICNRPDAVDVEQVMMWESIVENLFDTLCDQSASGAIMLRNMRVNDEMSEEDGDSNWKFFVCSTTNLFSYIIDYLRVRLPHYEQGAPDKQGMNRLVQLSGALSIQDGETTAFVIRSIITYLEQIILVCKKADTADDLDVHHVKQISRITLLLFKKLRILLDGCRPAIDNKGVSPSFNSLEPALQGSYGALNF